MSTEKIYLGRIHKALQYVEENLDQKLSLEIVSGVACYSPYHFHRIFKAYTQETLNSYIQRKRLERAASVLLTDDEMSLLELSSRVGFSSPSTFSRAFHQHYQLSPRDFRKQSQGNYSKIRKVDSKNGKELIEFEKYLSNIEWHQDWVQNKGKIQVKLIPAMKLAYVSHMGSFDEIGSAYGKLMRWAHVQGEVGKEVPLITLFHDNPNVSSIEKLRQSACISVDNGSKPSDEVNFMAFEGGKYLTGSFDIPHTDFEKAWQGMFVHLHESGYSFDQRDCLEMYPPGQARDARLKSIEICLPVK